MNPQKRKPDLRIVESHGHGKAVAGTKKTSSIQVHNVWASGDYLLLKSFRFTVDDPESRARALAKAQEFVRQYSSSFPEMKS